MKIQVLGSGCPTCKKLHEFAVEAARQAGVAGEVEYITDVNKILEMGLMQSPVLAIDDKPIFAGFVPDVNKIKELILKLDKP